MFTPPIMSHVMCHVTCHVMCHVSHVMCHVSHVMCHVSHVTFFFFFFSGRSGEAYRWRVCYQRGLPRLVIHFIGLYSLLLWIFAPVFFSLFPYFPLTSLLITLSSQQLYVHCNFHQRLVHMLLRCDCLLPFYCQMFCHNNVNRAQCDLSLHVFLYTFFKVNVLLHVTHTCLFFILGVLAAVIS